MTLQGKYKILQKIGKGGMSFVFKAFSIYHNKECALKEMQDQYLDPESKDKITVQFMNEAVTLSKLNHPGVPYVIETFEDNGKHYLAMEYVSGDSLEDVVMNLPGAQLLTQNQVLGLLWQILAILNYLHNLPEPVILRDLKPSNIMLSSEGKIKIIDFGIAKIFEQGGVGRTMAKIKGSGSSGFAPPEQYGAAGTDRRSDIYALGATVFYLLTGQVLPDSVDRILSGGRLESAAEYNSTVTAPVQKMMEKMVCLKPADRFQNVAEIAGYLEANGLKGNFPQVFPPKHITQEEEPAVTEPYSGRAAYEPEPEEDTRIYLPRRTYKKEQRAADAAADESPRSSSESYSAFRSPQDRESLRIADAIRDAEIRQKDKEDIAQASADAAMEPTQKLGPEILKKYIEDKKAREAAQTSFASQGGAFSSGNAQSAVKPKQEEPKTLSSIEEEQKKEVEGRGTKIAVNILIILISILLIILIVGCFFFKDAIMSINKKPVKVEDKPAVTETVKAKDDARKPVPAPAKPKKAYSEKSFQGEISSIEINKDSLKLRINTDNGYRLISVKRKALPAKAKKGAEIKAVCRIPNGAVKNSVFEAVKIEVIKEGPSTSSVPPVKRESSYREPAPVNKSYSKPSSGYSDYYEPAPARQAAPPPPPVPVSSGASSGSGSFTQQRETDY